MDASSSFDLPTGDFVAEDDPLAGLASVPAQGETDLHCSMLTFVDEIAVVEFSDVEPMAENMVDQVAVVGEVVATGNVYWPTIHRGNRRRLLRRIGRIVGSGVVPRRTCARAHGVPGIVSG